MPLWICLLPETAGCQTAGLIGQVRSVNSKDDNSREGAQANDHRPVTRTMISKHVKRRRAGSSRPTILFPVEDGLVVAGNQAQASMVGFGPYVEMHFAYHSYSPVDEDAQYENTTWCNRDLIPIPPNRRTYGVWSYFGTRLS